MDFLRVLVKVLIILAALLLMAAPFFAEYLTFKRDKRRKISFKRFRIVVYTLVYVIAATVALYLLKEFFLWLGSLSFVQWIVTRVGVAARVAYFGEVLVAVIVNVAVGALFVFLSKFVRIGLKKKNLTVPKKKDGEFGLMQRAERRVIKFFHTETWFFVGGILKYLSIILSAVYALVFAVYLIPALFSADWIPYNFISMLFSAGYIYPTITLLALWEMYFFLAGIKRMELECPEMLAEEDVGAKSAEVDINAIDEEVRKHFKDYYVCDVELSDAVQEEVAASEHHAITRFIARAVENDRRNPQKNKEIYLNCLDNLVRSGNSVLFNGGFFSEFSMYFLRYLSVIVSRGDNVVFVCNTDAQIDSVYNYLKEGLAELSSLYCEGFRTGAVDFDDPIWRIVKISGERDVIDEASIDDNSILVTSLSYLCSTDFESEHGRFIHLLDTIVFVDTLETVNTFSRQMTILNTRLKHITRNNARLAKNGSVNEGFKVRYMSRQVRYICFDDTRTPGLDKVLKNMLSVEFESIDAMNYNLKTVVRCYNFEGRPDESGRRVCPQFINSEEEIGAVMNMAVLCLAKGAGSVTVFADGVLPYENIAETITANMGQVAVKIDGSRIRLNKQYYNPDDYSVIIAMDSGDNLPAALRRYISMVSDKPALIIVFSRPYMLRDYYTANISKLWSSSQIERIPIEEGTEKDIARRILVGANAGGISEEDILNLAAGIPQFDGFVKSGDINSILRAILQIYGVPQVRRIDLYDYFEYSYSRDFDENGLYSSESRVLLRRQGELFDLINGRDMTVMLTGDREIILPIPRKRLTQHVIAGQNLLYGGSIYYIQKIDTEAGKVYARLAVGGKNKEAYRYVQAREYRPDVSAERIVSVFPTKHVVLNRTEEDVAVNDVYVSVFRAPMEVLTSGYYEIDPHTLAMNVEDSEYHSISDAGNDMLAKQTYRRYGDLTDGAYSSDSIFSDTDLVARDRGALMMTIRMSGRFGEDVNRTMALAAAMLGELLRSMFPSVADEIAVCPVLHGEFTDEESRALLQRQPRMTVTGENELFSGTDFELVIIEDSDTDLGVVSVLMSAGDDVLNTLFAPIFEYLRWYSEAEKKSDYLYYGLDHEPACFDFSSLHKLAKLLGDSKYDLKFVDIESLVEYEVCDFCGKRFAKGDGVTELEDGRRMCRECAENLVGNNKRVLRAHLDRAKIFLESTYGIELDEDYEFCFESAVKIANTLKRNRSLIKRGADIPLKAYTDDRKKVHVEYSVPSANLSELLVRELTYVWQLKHIPNVSEELAEGHIALVAVQYLRFLNQNALAGVRTNYYETTANISGEGYRKLVRELLANPQFNNNPFRYLLGATGSGGESVAPPTPRTIEAGDLGLPYTPEKPDRALDGNIEYFYYSRFTSTHRAAYDAMLAAIRNHEETVVVSGCTFEDVSRISAAIMYDHPELFAYKNFAMRGNEVLLSYGATAEEAELLQRRIDEVVPGYLEGIDDTMSAYDVAIRIHAKIIGSVDYDTIALDRQKKEGGPPADRIDYLRTICGVFLEGKAVCEGYARAVQYLLQKCGIECAEAAGCIRKETGEPDGGHAWNILKVDGEYYHLDTTWDDSSNTIQTVKKNDLGFDYFCITTDELTRTRSVDLCPTDMPVCSATRANYYTHNGLVIDGYDLEKIKTIARTAAANKSRSFTFKCRTKAVFDEALNMMCAVGQDCYDALKAAAKADKQILTNTYSYSYDKNVWTITVMFKYK